MFLLKIQIVLFCLLWALADSSVLAKVNDEDVVKHVVAEVQTELKEEEDKLAKSRFDFHSIPGHARFISSERSVAIERRNNLLRMASKKLTEASGFTTNEANQKILASEHFRAIDVCNETVIQCSSDEINSIFAPIGGRCNNPFNPILGTTNRPYRRILPACNRNITSTRETLLNTNRDDNSNEASNENGNKNPTGPVQCDTGNVLPNVRLVSRTIHTDRNVPSNLSQLFTMFGQFVCHDLLFTATQTKVPNCCAPSSLTDFVNCLPIIVPSGDSFFNTSQCIDFRRSTVFCEQTGQDRHHINQLTAYFDAGNIYGSDVKTATAIRTLSGGLLKVSSPGNLLPNISLTAGGTPKFTAGENRAIENPALTTIHTIFMREHNRIATLMSQRNPSLNDTEIYNQAKRIVTAELQSIVYGEFLPLLVGSKSLIGNGNSLTSYNPNVDPSITNEFSAAALRFGHTTVNGNFNQNDPLTGQSLGGYLLRTSNNNVSIYSNNPDLGMTSIAKGMTLQASQAHDNFMTVELTNFLYAATANNNLAFGSDLAARNIQRGRDNGLSGWVHYRRLCTGEDAPANWQSKPNDISAENWAKLKSLYVSVEDIDLFTGSLAEMPVRSGTVGITAKCIIEQQFKNLIYGDRYFFTHKGDVGAQFTKQQISALKDVTIFDIVCHNTNIKELQRKAFLIPRSASGNSLNPCQAARSIDISLFF